jgi:hypothetical protein
MWNIKKEILKGDKMEFIAAILLIFIIVSLCIVSFFGLIKFIGLEKRMDQFIYFIGNKILWA